MENSNSKLFAVLSYIGILWLIPLFAARDDEFAMFHANQGLVLCIAVFVLNFAIGILGIFIPFVSFVSYAIYIATLVFIILGIVNASKGEMKELPLIGGIKILK